MPSHCANKTKSKQLCLIFSCGIGKIITDLIVFDGFALAKSWILFHFSSCPASEPWTSKGKYLHNLVKDCL